MYHARGWVLHHNTDVWRATAPIDFANVGIWPTGGAWLLTHVWEHYLFTGDTKRSEAVLPDLRARRSSSSPRWSKSRRTAGWSLPEHVARTRRRSSPGRRWTTASCATCSRRRPRPREILDVDRRFRQKVLAARERLAPFQVGKYGQLQEWLAGHRPRERLAPPPLAPVRAVSQQPDHCRRDPKLFAAAKKSLLGRGDAATGWSLAWKLNLWAALPTAITPTCC